MAILTRNTVIAKLAREEKDKGQASEVGKFFTQSKVQEQIISSLKDAAELNRSLMDARTVDQEILIRQISI